MSQFFENLKERYRRIENTQAKRMVVGLIGGACLLVGVAMMVLPGPAFIFIPAGLAILALEFEWAQRWLDKAKQWVKDRKQRRQSRRSS